MSLEAWGDGGGDAWDGYVTEDRATEFFTFGAQAMREMLARFVENGPDSDAKTLAMSIRANWHPGWPTDPGKLDGDIPDDPWLCP